MRELSNEELKQLDLEAIYAWVEFALENPEEAKRIAQDYASFGLRKVGHVKADGSKSIAYIPAHKSREERNADRERRRARRERFYNRPSVEDYVKNARDNGDNRSDEAIVQEYVDAYYEI